MIKKIAFLTPLHPQKTGQADYVEEILPYLRNFLGNNYQIDLFVDQCTPNEADTIANHKIFDMELYEAKKEEYVITVYQIGNNPFHFKIYELALKYQGIVVLHDFAIHHIVAALLIGDRMQGEAYFDEVAFNHGEEAKRIAYQRSINGELGLWETDAIDYPMNRRIVQDSLGVIVFSQFAKDKLETYGCNVPIHRLYLHCSGKSEPCTQENCNDARKRLKIPQIKGETVVGVFGFIGPSKRPYTILQAIDTLIKKGYKIRLFYVGELQDRSKDLPIVIKKMNIGEHVQITGFITIEEFCDYVVASDICISLRYPTMGETSGVLMRALSRGKPSIVTNVGTFQEFSSDTVVKISADEKELQGLIEAIEKLICQPKYKAMIVKNSLHYAKEHLEIQSTAESFTKFIKTAIQFQAIKKNHMYQNLRNKIVQTYLETGEIDMLLDREVQTLIKIFGGIDL